MPPSCTGHTRALTCQRARLVSHVITRHHAPQVIEYSHSGRSLLALQVDAPLNNGVWGGPVFWRGQVVGMAHQKSSAQAWTER